MSDSFIKLKYQLDDTLAILLKFKHKIIIINNLLYAYFYFPLIETLLDNKL